MKSNLTLYFIIFVTVFGNACSSSKWVVENQNEVDRTDFTLLTTKKFLVKTGTTNPNSPIVTYQIKDENTFRYAQRIKTDRYIQKYRPSLRSVFFGLIGAGIASSAALTVNNTKTSDTILYSSAGFITLASLLNMKAIGTPTATGESRLLRKTGTIEETEIVVALPDPSLKALYSIYYKRQALLVDKEVEPNGSSYSINLIDELNPEIFEYDYNDFIRLEITFNEETYSENIPLRNIFEQFIVVSSQVTALRDEPKFDSRNILTDLAFGSQMKLVAEDSLWYKVLYGITETWISNKDAYPIWRPSEFASQLSIIAIPNIPFGNVDVENNIPRLLNRSNSNTFAFILANGEYQGRFSERSYANRDGRLIEEYLKNALSVPSNNITKALEIESQQQLTLAYNRLANNFRSPQKRLIVYVSGYVSSNNKEDLFIIPTIQSNENELFSLNSLFESIAKLKVEEIVVFADIDNIDTKNDQGLLERLSTTITSKNKKSVVIFSSTENQRSRDYSVANGDQKRHSIFTYYIADAMKNNQSSISAIINHLQCNVDYTSRRLHNKPQNVIIFGDPSLSLIE